jgi:hypothetical protein
MMLVFQVVDGWRRAWNGAPGRSRAQFEYASFQGLRARRHYPVPHQFFPGERFAFLRNPCPARCRIQLAYRVAFGGVKTLRFHRLRWSSFQLKDEYRRARTVL